MHLRFRLRAGSAMHIDTTLTHQLNALVGVSPTFDLLMILTANWCVHLLVLSIALRWWLSRNRADARHSAILCGLTTVLGLALNQFILLFVHRPRPYEFGVTHLIVDRTVDFSFPSDHATVAFAIAMPLLFKRDRFAPLYLAAASLVALSRVYVGIHFLGDIVGGALTAGLATCCVLALYRRDTKVDRLLVGLL
jgi:undecaprenyl-diphosphatase